MNRPRRPGGFGGPPRRRPGGPPQTHSGGPPPPRRRTALDAVPADVDPPFKVLGPGTDRQVLIGSALPLEMVVIQGYTREIEDAYQKSRLRAPEEFWKQNPGLIETARKLDEVLAKIRDRKSGS